MADLTNAVFFKFSRATARYLVLTSALTLLVSGQAGAFELKIPGFGGSKSSAPAAPAGGEAEKLYNEARKAYGSADYNKVIDLSGKAIAADPKSAKSYALRAKAKKDMGDVDAAIADANKAIQIDPGLGEAYSIRAQASEIMGDMKKAEADYQLACKNGHKEACK